MSVRSFQNYLLKIYDDSNEKNWFSDNTWGQFVNIEPQIITQIRDVVLSFNKNSTENKKNNIHTDEIPRVKSIPRIKSTKTLDLEGNMITSSLKENPNTAEKYEPTKAKYTYISVSCVLLCVYLYINTHL